MKKFLRDITLILSVALLWLVSGTVMGLGIRVAFGMQWISPCSSLNMLLGMLLLLTVMRDEQAKRRLFGEADEEMPFHLGLFALVGIPILCMGTGLVWILMAPFFP